eukprot:scaffold977_cov253-Pinguiococcus_pyrenoidosus.AAC.19
MNPWVAEEQLLPVDASTEILALFGLDAQVTHCTTMVKSLVWHSSNLHAHERPVDQVVNPLELEGAASPLEQLRLFRTLEHVKFITQFIGAVRRRIAENVNMSSHLQRLCVRTRLFAAICSPRRGHLAHHSAWAIDDDHAGVEPAPVHPT